MNRTHWTPSRLLTLSITLLLAVLAPGLAAPGPAAAPAPTPAPAGDNSLADLVKAVNSAANKGDTYRLSPSDVIRMKVFQEDELATEARIGKDGSVTIPLVGVVNLGGKTVEEATAHLRELFGKDYLVNPQVTLTVSEYAKRRFTVLGQVQKPGTYDIPSEESVTLLQAIAMAGGFNRLAVQGRVTVTRTLGGKRTFSVDLKSTANDPDTKPFEILPDDMIMVSERVF